MLPFIANHAAVDAAVTMPFLLLAGPDGHP
jgi:hypothetical protein